ncbi:hypothetical protein EJB05_13874, partial [Eragrostis curvula]
MSHVRTLIALGFAFQWIPPLSRFSVLRVLALHYSPNNKNNLNGLGSLHHLRYLELRGAVESEFVEEIGNLKHLKILVLQYASILELPPSIVQLTQLELLVTNRWTKFPDGIGNLVSLQQLGVLDLQTKPLFNFAELGNLSELRILAISGLDKFDESDMKTFFQSLSNLHNMHTLRIQDTILHSPDCMPDQWSGPAHLQCFDGSGSSLSKLPRWFSSLSELSCLSIKVKMLRQGDLQLLGGLPLLRSLDLTVDFNGTTEERLVIGADQPFRSLINFMFHNYTRCWLVFSPGAMQKLQMLVLYFQVQKREDGCFDVGLENLTSLKQAKVVVDCLRARVAAVEDAEAKCRDAIDKHPNSPTLQLSRNHDLYLKKDENKGHNEASKQQR